MHALDRRPDDVDPLDSRLAEVQGPRRPVASRWWLRHRPALGLAPTLSPGLILIPIGLGLGPGGLELLSTTTLTYLDPVISVAIAALGVFVGLGLDLRRRHEGRLLAAASLEAGVTVLLVGAGVLAADAIWFRTGSAVWVFAAVIGLCASASATAIGPANEPPTLVMRIGDLDDVLPIIVGGLALAWLRELSAAATLALAAAFLAISLAIAMAGWLLVRQTDSEREQHVFVAGTLLLLGGGAAQLSQSALAAGLVAGSLWNLLGGTARDRIGRDMRYFQHPLLVLLVIVAGARLVVSFEAVALALVYVTCRTAGKFAGGSLAGQILAGAPLKDLGLSLVAPGVAGIAFALNVLLAEGASDRSVTLLAVVTLGSVASESLSLVSRSQEAS